MNSRVPQGTVLEGIAKLCLGALFFMIALVLIQPKICFGANQDSSTVAVSGDDIYEKIENQEESVEVLLQSYRERIGARQDPFGLAFTPQQGAKVFRRLALRKKNGQWVDSPLGMINSSLRRSYAGQAKYDPQLASALIADIRNQLQNEDSEIEDLQSNYLALKYMHEYLGKHKKRYHPKPPAPEKEAPKPDQNQSSADQENPPSENESGQSDPKSESDKNKSKSEQDKTQSEKNQSKSEQDQSKSEQDKSRSEKNQSKSEQDKSRSEKNQSKSEQDKSRSEENQSKSEQDQSQSEKDQSKAEKEKLRSDKDQSQSKQDRSKSEKDQSQSEQDQSKSQKDQSQSEQDQTEQDQSKSSTGQSRSKQDKSQSNQDQSESGDGQSSEDQDSSGSQSDSEGGFGKYLDQLKDYFNLNDKKPPKKNPPKKGEKQKSPFDEMAEPPTPDDSSSDDKSEDDSTDESKDQPKDKANQQNPKENQDQKNNQDRPEDSPQDRSKNQSDRDHSRKNSPKQKKRKPQDQSRKDAKKKPQDGAKDQSTQDESVRNENSQAEKSDEVKSDEVKSKEEKSEDRKSGKSKAGKSNDRKSGQSGGTARGDDDADSDASSNSDESDDDLPKGSQKSSPRGTRKSLKKRTGSSEPESTENPDAPADQENAKGSADSENPANPDGSDGADHLENSKGSDDSENQENSESLESDGEIDDNSEFIKELQKLGKFDEDPAAEEERQRKLLAAKKPEKPDFELGSLQIEPRLDRNVLIDRIMRSLLQISLEPNQSGTQVLDRLNLLGKLVKNYRSGEVESLYQRALSAHTGEHPELRSWVEKIIGMVGTGSPDRVYQEIHRLKLALEIYSEVLDYDGKVAKPDALIALLDQIQVQLRDQMAPEDYDIALVQDLIKNLPAVPRILLKNDYGLTTVGRNMPTRLVADALKAGNLNNLRLVSFLSPLADFILNSSFRPESLEVKTRQRDLVRPRGQDLLFLQRWSDLSRALLGQPGRGFEENIQNGTAFVLGRRQRIKIPSFTGKHEPERITIVLYDTSGSMIGASARFQGGLVAAFVGKALSDVSLHGRHRHRVILVPFNNTPGTPQRVTNTHEALDVINQFTKGVNFTWGGTNIQLALLEAMNLIANAEKQAGEPLAATNIILMTDGIDDVNVEELRQARKMIDRRTPLQTMFVAIDQTNAELMEFAMDSKKIGAEKGFYREFKRPLICDYLRRADTLDPGAPDSIVIDKIPNEIVASLDQVQRMANDLADEIQRARRHTLIEEHLATLARAKPSEKTPMDRPLEKWLVQVRKLLLRQPVFARDAIVLDRVLDDLFENFARLTAIPFPELYERELEQFKHVLRHSTTKTATPGAMAK